MLKVLNLYAGIGGNRELWKNVTVVAVEIQPSIAKIYQDLYPDDKVIIGDAHAYLLKHFKGFDFIWSSPPCPTHSRINYSTVRKLDYPDMRLYQEVLILQNWYKGKWVVENVYPYYEPLIKPQYSGRHCFWSNFIIPKFSRDEGTKVRNDVGETTDWKLQQRGMSITNWHGYKGDKRTLLNNCVESNIGLKIFESAFKEKQTRLREVEVPIPLTSEDVSILGTKL